MSFLCANSSGRGCIRFTGHVDADSYNEFAGSLELFQSDNHSVCILSLYWTILEITKVFQDSLVCSANVLQASLWKVNVRGMVSGGVEKACRKGESIVILEIHGIVLKNRLPWLLSLCLGLSLSVLAGEMLATGKRLQVSRLRPDQL